MRLIRFIKPRDDNQLRVITRLGTVDVKVGQRDWNGREVIIVDVTPDRRGPGDGPSVFCTSKENVRLIEHKEGVPDTRPEGGPLYQHARDGGLDLTADSSAEVQPRGPLPSVRTLRNTGKCVWGDTGKGNVQIYFWAGRHFKMDVNAVPGAQVEEL